MAPQSKTAKQSLAVITEMVLPNDTNTLGNLMGGRLLHWMDIASAIAAQHRREARRGLVQVRQEIAGDGDAAGPAVGDGHIPQVREQQGQCPLQVSEKIGRAHV